MTDLPQQPSVSAGTSGASGPWSHQISDRYQIRLSDDLVDWFDREVWRYSSGAEYVEGVEPSVLIEAAPELIWPALMPPNLLPLIGNMAGDWLCVRVDEDSRAAEIVQWYHGGGDWISWGNSIAEAIVFDDVHPRLPGPGRRHSIPAEEFRGRQAVTCSIAGSDQYQAVTSVVDWALQHLPSEAAKLVHGDASDGELANALIRLRIAEIATRCEVVQDCLSENLSAVLDPKTAKTLGIDWNAALQWMFDLQQIPGEMRQRLIDELSVDLRTEQDWETAAQHCRAVTELTSQYGWAWEILGYAAERAGDPVAAIEAYRRGLDCSVFTDHSVRMRTHWAAGVAAKFSAARLSALQPAPSEPTLSDPDDYVQTMRISDADQWRSAATAYWTRVAEAQERAENWSAAHQSWIAAGWDCGAEPMSDYGRLLDRVAVTATKSGYAGRAEVARTHRNCLRERYGI